MKLFMNFKDGIYLTLIAVLLGVLVFKGCTKTKCPEIQTVIKYDTTFTTKDSVVYRDKLKYQPIPYLIRDTLVEKFKKDTVMSDDALAVITDYYETRVYNDSLYEGQNYVKITDTVSENLIKNRTYKFHVTSPTITKTVTNNIYPAPKTEFYYGAQLSGNKQYPFYGLDGMFLIKNKKDAIFGVAIGTDVYKQLNLKLSYAVKL